MAKSKAETFVGSGLTKDEISVGQKKYNDYLRHYQQLSKPSNLQLLEELVWLECLQERYKKQVGIITEPKADSSGKIKMEAIPKHLTETINDGLSQIINLKTKLGLFEDQKTSDAFQAFEDLKKKAEEYRRQNPLSFKVTCPHCSKIFFLKRRTENFDSMISPFYADDKVLKNDELHDCWREGILPIGRYAKALGVSTDYILWLDEKVYKHKHRPKNMTE